MAPRADDSTATATPIVNTVAADASNVASTSTKLRAIALSEVAKHNRREDAWLVVHGRVMDVTKFAKRHPGGDIILLGAGLDATILFESYHVRRVDLAVLNKYQIGVLDTSVSQEVANGESAASSYYNWDGDFLPTMQKRVVERLDKLGYQRRGGLLTKAAVIMTTFFVSYYFAFVHVFETSSLWPVFLWAFVYGAACAQIGLSIMHDANHGSFSYSSVVNKIAGMGMDIIGGSAIVWEYQHVVGHHQYTNLSTPTDRVREMRSSLDKPTTQIANDVDLKLLQENDPDVFSSYPLVRMHPTDPRFWYHSYQHIYASFLFGLFTMMKVVMNDAKFFFAGRVAHISMESRLNSWDERARFIFFKVMNIFATVAVPIYLHGMTRFAIAFCVAHIVAGEYLATCFIINHIGELCEFYTGGKAIDVPGADDNVGTVGKDIKVHPRDWAALQARATTNWAVGKPFWNHFSGGLNHQVEHHLFPGVAHVNYPYIADIVRDTCKEFDVSYHETPTFWGAWVLCMQYLKRMGNEDGHVKAE